MFGVNVASSRGGADAVRVSSRTNPVFFTLESTVDARGGGRGDGGDGGDVRSHSPPTASLVALETNAARTVDTVDMVDMIDMVGVGVTDAVYATYNVQANQTRIKSSLGADHPEEAQFEEVMRRLFTHEMSLSEGIKAFRGIAVQRGKQLGKLASASGDAACLAERREDAEELQCEGKTWSLLYYLFAHSRDDAVGAMASVAMASASADGVDPVDALPCHQDMSYPAGMGGRFVSGAGMEKTLRQRAADLVFQDGVLNRAARVVAWLEEERGREDVDPAEGLGRKDGVWKETRLGLDGNHTDDTLVRELDPDGMTRVREDGALHKDNAKDEERLAKVLWRLVRSGRLQLASQVCGYVGQPWRAASLTGCGRHGPLPLGDAAEAADVTDGGAEETLAGEVESATLGVEGGNKIMWRWACYHAARSIAARMEGAGHGRYESALYGVLSGDVKHAMLGCTSWEDSLWAVMRCWLEFQVDSELLGCDGGSDERKTGMLGSRSVSIDMAVDEADADDLDLDADDPRFDVDDQSTMTAGTAFPIPGVAAQMPGDLSGAVHKGAAEFGGIESTDKTKRFRKVQVDLMLGELDSLVESLKRWIVPSGATEEAQDCPPGLMRFSAHLALLLGWMNLMAIADDHGSLLRDSTNDGLQKLVWIYVIHLIDSASYELVPTYLVHLRKGLRRTTMQLLLEQATYNERIEIRKSVSSRCDQWLATCISVEGIGVEAGEMWASTQTFCDRSRRSSFGGPMTRAESISWMFFDPKNRREATAAAVALCRDFALSGVRGALAGLHLLREVIPPSCLDFDSLGSLSPELAAWETFFEVVREVTVWEQMFGQAAARLESNPDDPACDEALKELVPDTLRLFEGVVAFCEGSNCAQWIQSQDADGADTRDVDARAPLEAFLVIGPSTSSVDEEVAYDTSLYPVYSDAELSDACAAARAMCELATAAASSSSSTTLLHAVGPASEVAPPGCDLPGLVGVKVWAPRSDVDRRAFESAAVALFCGVLKSEALDVKATNIMSSFSVSSALCKAIVTPKLVIDVANLRAALDFMGSLPDCGAELLIDAETLVEAAKADGVGGGEGRWSQEEIKQLLV